MYTDGQSAFVSVIVGAGAAWFGLYVNSSKSSVKVTSDTETKVKK